MNVLKAEIQSCLKRKDIHITFLLMLIISISAFVIECLSFYGLDLKFVRSSAESSLFQGVYAGSVKATLIFILPLLSSLIYSDSFYTDYHNGVLKTIITKVNKSKYITYKAITIFSLTFAVIFISLFINLILSAITFPSTGFDNVGALPAYDIGVQNYKNGYFLEILRLESPFLFNVISVFILSLFGGLFSILTLGIYFLCLSKNKIVGLFLSFLFYVCINLLLAFLGFDKLTLTYQLDTTHIGTISQLLLWIIFILAISIYLLKKGIDQELIN
ncbi:hypothetical protein RCG19_11975 [Neobacillus sp. OS1-2]|uniref:hypothetical protein n=1 Tax=Neobacillus sp. OS1-2 TaxID=3070680 RepID=UPI0027E1E5AD|nr:hypothetical protein [Neobacillus sp. OS1-2]WML37966.1 hypothetical protein RCG19_11975 [Neobacillus sp. OS1-2]